METKCGVRRRPHVEAKDAHTVNSMREEGEGGRGGGLQGWMEDSRGPRAVFQEALEVVPTQLTLPSSPGVPTSPGGHSLQP